MEKRARLVLEDGSSFDGLSFGAEGFSVGEVIFNTSITGYQEIISDPSYARQIVTLTHPHIGNVGANAGDIESNIIHASGLVVKQLPKIVSNWRSELSLSKFLKVNEVVGISGIDTRRLTRLLRIKGAQNGCIYTVDALSEEQALEKAREFEGLKGLDLAKVVTTGNSYLWNDGLHDLITNSSKTMRASKAQLSVIAYDYGVKQNILRMLSERGCRVKVVPAKTTLDELKGEQIDGLFFSNGPGDPEPCDYAIDTIREALNQDIPIFGICLGHQLFALACGGRTAKMKFGHHGANHPVKNLRTNEIFITSQNHGFTVDDEGLPEELDVTHRSLFDGTIQGLEHKSKPAFSFQGHPEASPGPRETNAMFDQFIDNMLHARNNSESRN